jgi:hypothetical protein
MVREAGGRSLEQRTCVWVECVDRRACVRFDSEAADAKCALKSPLELHLGRAHHLAMQANTIT